MDGIRHLIPIALLIALTACGGGGGGGDDGEFEETGIEGGLSINATSIRFEADSFGPLPAPKSYTITWSAAEIEEVLVGTPAGQPLPTWLDLGLTGNASPLTLTVSIVATNLSGNTYPSTIRIASGDSNGFILDLIDIPLTLVINEVLGTLTPERIFSHIPGGALPAPQFMQISGENLRWNATIDQPWVALAQTSGTAPSNVTMTVDPAGLSLGRNNAVITVTNVDEPSESIAIDVHLDIIAPAIELSETGMVFFGVNGGPLGSKTTSFSLNSGQITDWVANVSDPWIILDQNSWNGPGSVEVSVDPGVAGLPSGNHTGSVTLSTMTGGNPISVDIPIELQLSPATITAFPSPLVFRGGSAEDILPQSFNLSVNTFTNAYPLQVDLVTGSGGNWLRSSNVPGSLSQLQARPEISVDTNGLVGGTYTGSVDISVQVNGDTLTKSLPVELHLDDTRLVVEDNGVAFVSSPTISRLSHRVRVADNRDGGGITWNALSDQGWLGVTASGSTDDDLVLTADPTGLATETIHYALVTVSSGDLGVSNSETIRVGFYVTASAPLDQVNLAVPTFTGFEDTGMVADPIRPWVYVTHRGSDIEVYNIYTGALVTTILNAGTDLRNMTISGDGGRLYVLDYAGNSIVTVDLDANPLNANPPWTNVAWSNCACQSARNSQFEYVRIKGRPLLVAAAEEIIDAITGARLYSSSPGSFLDTEVFGDVTARGSLLFSAASNTLPHEIKRSLIDYDLQLDAFAITETHSVTRQAFNRGLSADPDGIAVYRACWYPLNQVEAYSGADLSLLGPIDTGPNGSALYAEDGLVYCSRYFADIDGTHGGDVWSVDPNTNAVINEFNVDGEIHKGMYRISGDGQRLITRSNDQATLSMTTIP